MISFQLCSFWLSEMPRSMTWSECEEELAIGSINASFIKNNKPLEKLEVGLDCRYNPIKLASLPKRAVLFSLLKLAYSSNGFSR